MLPPRLEHFRDEAVAHVELSLRPTAALVPRLLERQRLLIVDDGIMRPARLDALRHALHREFHILGETGRLPAVLLEDLRIEAHTCAAEAGGEPDVGLREMRDIADDPERDGERARHPGVVWVLRVHIALDDFIPLAEPVVHLHEELRVHEIVSVKDTDGVVLLLHLEQAIEHPVKRIALALLCRMRAHMHERTGLCGDLRRIIRAVVGDDVDIVHVFRIVQLLEILYELPDDRVLIMRRYDERERLARRRDLLLLAPPHAAEADDEEIKREEENQNLHWHHDDVKGMCQSHGSILFAKQ